MKPAHIWIRTDFAVEAQDGKRQHAFLLRDAIAKQELLRYFVIGNFETASGEPVQFDKELTGCDSMNDFCGNFERALVEGEKEVREKMAALKTAIALPTEGQKTKILNGFDKTTNRMNGGLQR